MDQVRMERRDGDGGGGGGVCGGVFHTWLTVECIHAKLRHHLRRDVCYVLMCVLLLAPQRDGHPSGEGWSLAEGG